MDKTLTKALEDENVRVLKSDNICIGEKMPLPNGMVLFGNMRGGMTYRNSSIDYWEIGFWKKHKPAELFG